ncbi:hypothetical protein HOLleu_10592 [Holothuria leucospilota]|uniref:Parvovirus non-structural protein 1 helicase domain-containing protein n=1 Tax=Holothuria leucospilota TaxID=206669 RepID=A0A9Q1CDU8_HOLLE|nr:hypothetical protein HOLleu_10592 [Holothuria leucospilota]
MLTFLLQVALDMADAKTIERQNKVLTDLLREQDGDCVEGCGSRWLTLASHILLRNNIHAAHFAQAVWELLEKGRGKYRYLHITGPANCGKTFILLPITVIFQTSPNPATNTFAWVGAEKLDGILRHTNTTVLHSVI